MNALGTHGFEALLTELCERMTAESRSDQPYEDSTKFEHRVREVLRDLLLSHKFEVNFSPHPYGFPDIALGKFGVEVKYTANDTWRSVANSVFERYRDKDVKQIYVVFGKMGGTPEVRWSRYEDSVMHVRTSHVPRFELEIGAQEPLFTKFGVTYEQFTALSEDARMEHIRKYARSRLKTGERLWWLEAPGEKQHTLPLQVELFANLDDEEKLRARAEAALLCPQIVGSGRNRTKYTDAILYLLTYRGILATRDAFSAGSVAGPARGGIYVQRALENIQPQMIQAAAYLDEALFLEYWGERVAPQHRIGKWLASADSHAKRANPAWKPSKVLFRTL